MAEDMTELRRWYAEDLRLRAPIRRNPAIVAAFAAVPRERFLGRGPWRIIAESDLDCPFLTPDGDARWVYHDVLVTIDVARGLNNGVPRLWAGIFDHLDLARGQRVLQVGAGTGYYTAVLAEITGPEGRVVAVEVDDALAERARANLSAWPQVEVVAGDGRTHDAGEVDRIIVFAGSTHPAPLWLDRLAAGGQLMMPLTTDNRWGFLLRVTQRADHDTNLILMPWARDRFDAASIGRVGIFPCLGGRDAKAAKRLEEALRSLAGRADIPIAALHRGEPGPEAQVWYHGPGFWLEHKPTD